MAIDMLEEYLKDFNSKKLTKDRTKFNNFVDTTDAYANSGLQLGFEHVPTGKTINFKAYITAFNETFSSDWATETVFGRVDPIAMFKQTTRNVTLSFKVVAATPSEGFENLYRVDVLRSFLYPTYVDTGNAITLAQSPLVRVKVMNLLTDGAESNTYDQMFGAGLMTAMQGALTIIKSMSVAHNLDNPDVGVFHPGTSGQLSETDARLAEELGSPQPQLDPTSVTGVIPKAIDIALDFMIIHEDNMGWRNNKTNHVYGIDMEKTINPEEDSEPTPTQSDSDSESGAASQAATDTRIAKWAQGVEARMDARASARAGRQYDRSVESAYDNFDRDQAAAAAAGHQSWMDQARAGMSATQNEARYDQMITEDLLAGVFGAGSD